MVFFLTAFFSHLIEEFGSTVKITDEERLGHGNIYWRLVRPNQDRDVGPLHRDKWFWDIDRSQTLPSQPFRRIKCWLPLASDYNLNGLLLLKNSHQNKSISWSIFKKDGRLKPMIDISSLSGNPSPAPVDLGDVLLFHDELVHGGSINRADYTRISLEFTMFVHI